MPIIMTTTNGTQAIEKSRGAGEILIGAFPNLQATISYIQKKGKDVLIFVLASRSTFENLLHHISQVYDSLFIDSSW